MEYSLECHLARDTGDILQVLGDLVPSGEVLVRWGVVGRLDVVVLQDEGIEHDNLAMRMKHIDG